MVTGFTDHHGRLCGKRFTAAFFLEHVAIEGTHGCDYLLTTDLELEPVAGYRFAGWDLGYGDVHLVPDLTTLRRAAWLDRSALVLCDVRHPSTHDLTSVAPRTVLRAQVARLLDQGFTAMAATELEHFLFRTSYRDAARSGYDELEPAGWYLEDYQLQQGARTEDFHAAVRRHLDASGVPVESSKGEWGLGQHEVNVRYAEVLETADRHTVFKQCLKEIGGPPGRQRDVHGQAARRSGRVELPRAPQPVAGRSERLRRRPRSRGRPGSRVAGAAVVPRRLPPLGARAGRAARPHGELLQAVRRGVVGTHPHRLELRQPHGRLPAGRRRPEPAHRVPHPRGRLQPVPGARRARRGRLGGDRAAGRTTATLRRRCLRRRVTRPASPHPPRRHRRLRDQRAGASAPWGRRWSSTTRRCSAPSRPPSTPP